jgi:hypothetical protein
MEIEADEAALQPVVDRKRKDRADVGIDRRLVVTVQEGEESARVVRESPPVRQVAHVADPRPHSGVDILIRGPQPSRLRQPHHVPDLDAEAPQSPCRHAGWRIAPVAGGANNLLYRATSAAAEYAVKFTVRDERDRAGREYAALSLLEQAGLQIAPRAIALERERYRQPVVVQSWLDGAVLTGPPDCTADWQALLATPASSLELVRARGTALATLAWAPIARALPAKRLFIVAEGPLLRLPWSALPDGDGYLVERAKVVREGAVCCVEKA